LLTHIHVHADAQKRYSDKAVAPRKGGMSKQALTGLIESLEATVKKLVWKPAGTEWGDYYENTNYTDSAFEHKRQLVKEWSAEKKPALVWDLGGNTGVFSREASSSGAFTVSFDIDPAAVEQNYRVVKAQKEQNILPLVLDLTNPSPALGWDNTERDSFSVRGPVDMALALAVIHHLAISNNVPLPQLADFFAAHCKWLVIEFVPKSDSQAQKLLASREDVFPDYTREGFEAEFSARFTIHKCEAVRDSERALYLMAKK
jgi:ribosomal protein L11 methylase PrmA